MFKNSNKKGFTLIELLVVIAIIGILSAVVLASLSAARAKAKDAAVIEQMASLRTQAELFYGSNGNSYVDTMGMGPSYDSCHSSQNDDGTTGMFFNTDKNGLGNLIEGIRKGIDGGANPSLVRCWSADKHWIVVSKLPSDLGGSIWCVDSKGNSLSKDASFFLTSFAAGDVTSCQP